MPKLNGFIGPAYEVQSPNINAQRTINLYPQLDESGTAKNVASLLSVDQALIPQGDQFNWRTGGFGRGN